MMTVFRFSDIHGENISSFCPIAIYKSYIGAQTFINVTGLGGKKDFISLRVSIIFAVSFRRFYVQLLLKRSMTKKVPLVIFSSKIVTYQFGI